MILLPSVYLGNLYYYQLIKRYGEVCTELYEHYPKQTYRNRCSIYGANGALDLIIPVEKGQGQRKVMKDVKINHSSDWRKLHWRSLESAYRRSPYFEYYENELEPLYAKPYTYLIDFNRTAHEKVCKLLDIPLSTLVTSAYEKEPSVKTDYRDAFDPRVNPGDAFHEKPYTQVFETRHGFIANLSIVDLLCNEGPAASDYL